MERSKFVDADESSLTIKVSLNHCSHMRYHSHERREEVWIFISGTGRVILDDVEKMIAPGDIVEILVDCKHTVIADEPLKIIEV